MSFRSLQTLEAYARAKELSLEDPARLQGITLALMVHGTLAVSFALLAIVCERRWQRPFPWPVTALGATAVCLVVALEVLRHLPSGEGGLGALSWFLTAIIAIPAALVFAFVATWWMVKHAGLSPAKWCALMALAYVALVSNYGLAHW